MAQRLVDVVDHLDAEHDFLGIELEAASPGLATPTLERASMELLERQHVFLGLEGYLALPFLDVRAQQLPNLDFVTPELSFEVNGTFSLFIDNRRPGHTLEDLA